MYVTSALGPDLRLPHPSASLPLKRNKKVKMHLPVVTMLETFPEHEEPQSPGLHVF